MKGREPWASERNQIQAGGVELVRFETRIVEDALHHHAG